MHGNTPKCESLMRLGSAGFVIAGLCLSICACAPRQTRSVGDPEDAQPVTLGQALQSTDCQIPAFVNLSPHMTEFGNTPTWGLSFGDVNRDGLPDLFVADHMHFPSQLLMQSDSGRFEPVETSIASQSGMDDHHAVWFDVDGDGDLDLYTTNGYHREDNLLLQTAAMEFENQTPAWSGLHGDFGRGRSALAVDCTGDGFDDILVVNVDTPNFLYRNSGGRELFDEASERGVGFTMKSFGAIPGDFDEDGDQDLFFPSMSQKCQLLINRGDGFFEERAIQSEPILSHNWAAAAGDIDGDLDLDLFLTGRSACHLLVNDGDANFSLLGQDDELSALSFRGITNAGFADLDNDSDLDLLVIDGGDESLYNGSPRLFLNDGSGRFASHPLTDLPRAFGNACGLAFADWNLDGWTDFAISNGFGTREITGDLQLLQNRGHCSDPGPGNWIRVYTPRDHGSRCGLRATVVVDLPDGNRLLRESGVYRILAQDQAAVNVGIGAASHVTNLSIRWPDGSTSQRQLIPKEESVLVAASSNRTLIRSHPSALLSDGHPDYVQQLERRLESLLPQDQWPEPDEVDLASRTSELISHLTIQQALKTIPSGSDPSAIVHEVPEKRWLEIISLGRFAESKRPPKISNTTIQRVKDRLVGRRDPLEIADEFDIRGFDSGIRGCVRRGWYSQQAIRHLFDQHWEKIWTAARGAVLGPLSQKEKLDLQDESKIWPLKHLVHVGPRWNQSNLSEKDLMNPQLDRRRRTRRLLRQWEIPHDESIPLVVAPSTVSMVNHVRYPLEGVEAYSEQDQEMKATQERAISLALREARADAAANWLLDRQIEEAIQASRADTTVQPTESQFFARLFFLKNQKVALDVKRAVDSREPIDDIIGEFEIPDLRTRDARRSDKHFYDARCDRSFCDRILGRGNYESLAALEPGRASRIINRGTGFYIVVSTGIASQSELQPETLIKNQRALAQIEAVRSMNALLFEVTRQPNE